MFDNNDYSTIKEDKFLVKGKKFGIEYDSVGIVGSAQGEFVSVEHEIFFFRVPGRGVVGYPSKKLIELVPLDGKKEKIENQKTEKARKMPFSKI